ncbi:biotin transporter BioY [Priestia endophytica]|uniref:biotin transporter BioY n=1 Tax=Priestia endophytica TaxID=135735 RepID=UPI000DCA9031|nr:biotin transporter BioY [Priestia endophytica]RAS86810.1 biotin transporter BioY [Priestia endophytica]
MKTKELAFVSMMAAIMGVFGLFPPIMLTFTPVPIVLQNFVVMLSGGLLGARLGALSQGLFLLLIAAGMPLLTGGRGGFSVFVGPSGGFLLSYPLAAFVIGFIIHKIIKKQNFLNIFSATIVGGILTTYAVGVPVQAAFMNISFLHALKLSVVYLPGDLIKAAAASFFILKLARVLRPKLKITTSKAS